MTKLRWQIAQAAEIRWWKKYLQAKPREAYLPWKSAYWSNLLAQINDVLQWKPGDRVLDAGCGPAGIFMVLQDYRVTAIDPLLDAYANDLPHFRRKDYPYAQFINTSIEDYQPEATFDTVFCLNAINHVADLDKSFDRIVSAVRPGGQLVVSIDAHNYTFFKHLFRLIPGDVLHPHQYDIREYEKMLTDRGGKIIKKIALKREFFFSYYLLVVGL